VLELAPEHADAWNNLGIVHRIQDRTEDAEEALQRAIQINPELVDAHYNLGALLHSQRRPEEAVEALQRVLALNPNYTLAYRTMGPLLYLLGRRDEAAEIYRSWLRRSPDHPVALHMLAACTGENVPERASDHYIRTLFDGHAGSFDENLIEHLHYRAPQLVADVLDQCYSESDAGLDILDAGCGTGLCGPLIKPHARSLLGVDLSPKMLAEAERREVYDALVEAELTAFLQDHPDAFDLIVSADTLCYLGQLADFSRAAADALRPGGRLVFTVERLAGTGGTPGFALTESGRYAHGEDYLRQTLAASGLTIESLDRSDLRKEGGRPVAGLIVCSLLPV
jgi:predicted TPR repeat methyltransferase